MNKGPLALVEVYNDELYKVKNDDVQDIVVLSRVLAHPTNIGMQNLGNSVIEKVDGKKLKSFKQFVDVIHDRSNDVIKLTLFPGHKPVLFSKKVLRSADNEIKNLYGIKKLENLNK